MKKILIALLVLVLALTLIACGTPDETTLPGGEKIDPVDPDTDTSTPDGTGNDPIVTPAHSADTPHDFVEKIVVAPTCTSLGKSAKQCSCGEIEEGSEMPLPFALHDANEVSCTEDSVCKTCGKVLVEKYGHNYVETVITLASCTTTGETTTKCSRCGEVGENKIIPMGHDYDLDALQVSKGSVSAKCTKCGITSNFTENATPAFKLDFDSAAELDALSGFKVTKPSAIKFESSTCQPNGALFIGYEPEFVTSMSRFVISFDFKIAEQGQTTRGESIFTFVASPDTYNWLVKFYQANGVISTASSGFNASNSVPATQGKWYNFVAVVDVATNNATVYIDGTCIGSRAIPNHRSATLSDFRLRLYDAMPGNGTSNPYFDNFKIIEIK